MHATPMEVIDILVLVPSKLLDRRILNGLGGFKYNIELLHRSHFLERDTH